MIAVLLHALLRGVDHARAHRDAGPMAFRIAILRRARPFERLRLDRLGDAVLHRVFEAADVDGQQHVGGAVGALGLDALLEAGARRDDVDLDAGVLGEGVEQRLDQLALAIGVDIDLVGARRRVTRRSANRAGHGQRCKCSRRRIEDSPVDVDRGALGRCRPRAAEPDLLLLSVAGQGKFCRKINILEGFQTTRSGMNRNCRLAA